MNCVCSHSHNVYEILDSKRKGEELCTCQIQWFVNELVSNHVEQSQIGAFLMAVCVQGMTDIETANLTTSMALSGKSLQWNEQIQPLVVDKHSTGGVGDKISIPLGPILASLGLIYPSISGRGLGITGGTIDKLESIPDYKCEFNVREIQNICKTVGCCIVGQSGEINPADKILYATRDITATIANVPLITASIVSKKYCESLSTLLVDIKCGQSAFMSTLPKAVELAESIKKISEHLGIKCVAMITSMDVPIGRCIGNSLEIEESIEILKGKGHPDILNLIIEFGSRLLCQSGIVASLDTSIDKIKGVIADGIALAKFFEMLKYQGVSSQTIDKLSSGDYEEVFGIPKHKYTSISTQQGFVKFIDAHRLALIVKHLGGGRQKSDDVLDLQVGIRIFKHVGDQINIGDIWCELQYNKSNVEFTSEVDASIVIDEDHKNCKLDRVLRIFDKFNN